MRTLQGDQAKTHNSPDALCRLDRDHEIGDALKADPDGVPGPQTIRIGLQRASGLLRVLPAQRDGSGSYGQNGID